MKKLPVILCAALLISALLCALVFPAAGLSAGDSLITRSYAENTLLPSLTARLQTKADAGFSSENPLFSRLDASTADLTARLSAAGLAKTLAAPAATAVTGRGSVIPSRASVPVTLARGDSVKGAIGTEFTLYSGAAKTAGSGLLINVSAGKEVSAGTALSPYARYLQSEKTGASVTASADGTVIYVAGAYTVTRANAYVQENAAMAFALRQMHLISGTGAGFKLTKKTTRDEALIFLLNYMGLTEEAAKTTGDCPFRDVADWFRPYVTYAYQIGLTAGTSATTYNPNDEIAPDSFVTFFLRCLGYSDAGGKDFTYDKAIDKAVSLGILSGNERAYLRKSVFVRDKAVYACYAMLDASTTAGATLYDTLIAKGVFTAEEGAAARGGVIRTKA